MPLLQAQLLGKIIFRDIFAHKQVETVWGSQNVHAILAMLYFYCFAVSLQVPPSRHNLFQFRKSNTHHL